MINQIKHPSILIVDDVPNNLRLLEDILTPLRYKLYFSTNGTQALSIAEQKKPDLILLDILMPELNGYEVCQKLKQNLSTRNIPVIFISALHEAEEKAKALEVGGVDFVTKPFDPIEIKARIASHLSRASVLIEIDTLLKLTYHELNTPLCIIDTAISLQKKASGESKYLDNIHAASKTLHSIYKDLYFFLQERQHKKESFAQPIDLFSFIQARLNYFDIIAKTNKVEITLTGKEDSPKLSITHMELERLVDNLLSNAIRYAKEGSSISISTSTKADTIMLIQNSVGSGKNSAPYEASIAGLGHEIVNTICKQNSMNLHFHIEENQAHTRLAAQGESA